MTNEPQVLKAALLLFAFVIIGTVIAVVMSE